MTKQEFKQLREGDMVILQRAGKDNGKAALVKSISINGSIVYKLEGVLLVGHYTKFKRPK